jgi:transposase
MFQVSKLSIYKWFDRFEAAGVAGLKNQPGRGRKPLLQIENNIHRQVVADHIKKEPQRLKVAKAQIEKVLGQPLSESTLKRFLKSVATAGNDSESGLNRSKTL